MILLALVIYPIKLNNGSVRARNLAVTQKSPNLPQSHTKTFFTLCGFHFLGVISIPTFQLAVIAQHYVLDFFFNSSWVLFELNQIRDIDQFLKRVLLDLLLSCKTSLRPGCKFPVLSFFDNWTLWPLCNNAVDHSVLLEGTFVLSSIFECKNTVTLFVVLQPITFVLAPV